MTRLFSMALMAALMVMSAPFTSSQAADEFGPRFTNQAPAALQGPESDALIATQDSDAAGNELNEIAPAAGNAVDGVTPASDNVVGEEIGKELGAPVAHTEVDRGAGDTSQHDSVGEGDVGVFYKNNSDDRIKDTDDAVGVEFRLMKFN